MHTLEARLPLPGLAAKLIEEPNFLSKKIVLCVWGTERPGVSILFSLFTDELAIDKKEVKLGGHCLNTFAFVYTYTKLCICINITYASHLYIHGHSKIYLPIKFFYFFFFILKSALLLPRPDSNSLCSLGYPWTPIIVLPHPSNAETIGEGYCTHLS